MLRRRSKSIPSLIAIILRHRLLPAIPCCRDITRRCRCCRRHGELARSNPRPAPGIQFHVFGLPLSLPAGATFIGSIRYLGSVHMRLEEIAPSANAAKESVEMVNLALGLIRSTQVTLGAQNANTADWEAFVRSMKVEQKGQSSHLPGHCSHPPGTKPAVGPERVPQPRQLPLEIPRRRLPSEPLISAEHSFAPHFCGCYTLRSSAIPMRLPPSNPPRRNPA